MVLDGQEKTQRLLKNIHIRKGQAMSAEIIVAIITGAVTLIGVLISNGKTQAVTDAKLEELTREVREHNNFARRVPVVEEQVKVINHRLADLESQQKGRNV